jgi:hypothetical protein
MGKYADEFKKSYEQGTQDTRKEIDTVGSGEDMSYEYSHRIACQTMFVSMLAAVLAGIYTSLIARAGVIVAILVAFGVWCAGVVVLSLILSLNFGLQARRAKKSEIEAGGSETRQSVSTQRSRDFTESGALFELEQTHLFKCLAVIGSGTYALRGHEEQQIAVLRSFLKHARQEGANWQRLYSVIYEMWSAKRPLLPTVEEMTKQMDRADFDNN